MKKKRLGIAVLLILLAGGYFAATRFSLMTGQMNKGQKIIAIDPGHGGFDPGKIGVNNLLEKDINLSIALKLKLLLEEKGYAVVMTRETDDSVHGEKQKGSKQEDMRKRVECINESGALIALSIHQNSFSQSSIRGAQVFYYPNSEEAKKLAETLQVKMRETIGDDNKREAKANDSYYMMKKTKCPLVIVECGFLSNYEEAELLGTEAYQELIAKGILEGVLAYLEDGTGTDVIQ